MNPNPFLGVIFHWIGGFCSATNFIPFRGIKRWSWEVYWIIQGVAAWLVAPTLIALIFVPQPFAILKTAYAASPGNIYWPVFWGLLWGVGGLTFGLAIRYLGLGLGYAIALGFCTVFGTIVPPLWDGQMHAILHSTSGQITLSGLLLTLIAIAVSGAAGASKEREITPEEKAETGERDYSFVKGLVIAVFAGVMSAFFAIGLAAGKPIGDLTRSTLIAGGHLTLWSNLPVLIVVLWGGFLTNFIWSLILLAKNHSFAQFGGAPGENPMGTAATTGETLVDFDPRDYIGRINPQVLTMNYLFAASAGVIWYFQFFFYSMGQTKMGRFDFASWTLHMASIIIFANLWGLVLKEWKGTSAKTRGLVFTGLVLLVGSTVVVGYGSYLAANVH